MTTAVLVNRWQPERLATAATRTRAVQAAIESVLLELLRAVGGALFAARAWSGSAAVRCRATLDERQAVLRTASSRLSELSQLLDQAASQLSERLARVRTAEAEVDGTNSGLPVVGAVLSPVAFAWWRCQRVDSLHEQVTALIAADRRLAGDFDASARAARALRREHEVGQVRAGLTLSGVPAGGGGLAGPGGAGGAVVMPSPGADPQLVADWWASRTADERLTLESGPFAVRLGSLAGLPSTVRDRVNRVALTRRLAAYDEASADEVQRSAHEVDRTIDAELRRLSGALPGSPVLLLLDEPGRWGTGRAAIAVGDPDTAPNVAYLVPGLDDRVVTSLALDDTRAAAVARSAGGTAGGAAGGNAGTAVVAWLGYQTPVLRTVASSGSAVRGADLLGTEISGLVASRGSNDPHLTVVGHSYGSTTAAIAAVRAPGVIDDLVLVGSPGVLAERAADLPVPQSHVWVGASDDDLVSRLAWFGPDPAGTGFGAQRFAAEVTAPGPGLFDAHGHYFDAAGQSLSNLGQIIAGDTVAVPTVPRR